MGIFFTISGYVTAIPSMKKNKYLLRMKQQSFGMLL